MEPSFGFKLHEPGKQPPLPRPTSHRRMLCIIHRETAVVTRLFILSFDALQVWVKTAMTWKRLRRVKADQVSSSGIRRCEHLLVCSPHHLVFQSACSILTGGFLLCERFSVRSLDWLAPCVAGKPSAFPSRISVLAVSSPGPAARSST